ncbi:MAG: hypothetical protein QME64_12045 [bacterium]|nr:hypothetical protein [bacterium]
MVARKTKEKTADLNTVLTQIEKKQNAPVYLLYGEDTVAIHQAKRKLINQLILPEFRDGNLNEYAGKGLDLMELITVSDTYPFLADRRVIVIENYPYISGTKKLAAKPAAELDRFAEYISKRQASWTIIIFTFEEDKEKGRTISKAKPLVDAIKKKGVIIEFPFKGVIFKFIDALGERDSALALNYLHSFFYNEVEEKEPNAIHKMISRNIRFWLQALLLKGESSEEELPDSASLNINKQKPSFPRFKVEQQAKRFSKKELITATTDLVALEDKLNPRATDIIAEDPELILEKWLVKFCEGEA